MKFSFILLESFVVAEFFDFTTDASTSTSSTTLSTIQSGILAYVFYFLEIIILLKVSEFFYKNLENLDLSINFLFKGYWNSVQNDEALEQEFESSTGIDGLLERGKKKKIQPTKEQ